VALDQCIARGKRTKHAEFKDRTISDAFQEERASPMAPRVPFDGFPGKAARASTLMIVAGLNRYSAVARAAGRIVTARSNAVRNAAIFDNEVAAGHPRNFRRGKIIGDPWHDWPEASKKYGIEMLERNAGGFGCELPIGFGVVFVATFFPGCDFLEQGCAAGDAAVEAWASAP